MKKIGIVADNYKLDRFKKEFSKNGFADLKTTPLTSETTTISINVEDSQFIKSRDKIHAICIKVEAHFKRSN